MSHWVTARWDALGPPCLLHPRSTQGGESACRVSKGIGALAVPCVGQTELPRVPLPGVLTGQVMPREVTAL